MLVDTATRAAAAVAGRTMTDVGARIRTTMDHLPVEPVAATDVATIQPVIDALAGIGSDAQGAAALLGQHPMTSALQSMAGGVAGAATSASQRLATELQAGTSADVLAGTRRSMATRADVAEATGRLARRVASGRVTTARTTSEGLHRLDQLLQRDPRSLRVNELHELAAVGAELLPPDQASLLRKLTDVRASGGNIRRDSWAESNVESIVRRLRWERLGTRESSSVRTDAVIDAWRAGTGTPADAHDLAGIALLDDARRPAWMPPGVESLLRESASSNGTAITAEILADLRARGGVTSRAQQLELLGATPEALLADRAQLHRTAATALQLTPDYDRSASGFGSPRLAFTTYVDTKDVSKGAFAGELLALKQRVVLDVDPDTAMQRLHELAARPHADLSAAELGEFGALLRRVDTIAPDRLPSQVAGVTWVHRGDPFLSASTQRWSQLPRVLDAEVGSLRAQAAIDGGADPTAMLERVVAVPAGQRTADERMQLAGLALLRGAQAPRMTGDSLAAYFADPGIAPSVQLAAAQRWAEGLGEPAARARLAEIALDRAAPSRMAVLAEAAAIGDRYPTIPATPAQRTLLRTAADLFRKGANDESPLPGSWEAFASHDPDWLAGQLLHRADEALVAEPGTSWTRRFPAQASAVELLQRLPFDAEQRHWDFARELLRTRPDPAALAAARPTAEDLAGAMRRAETAPELDDPASLAAIDHARTRVREARSALTSAVEAASTTGLPGASRQPLAGGLGQLEQVVTDVARGGTEARAAGSVAGDMLDPTVPVLVDSINRFEHTLDGGGDQWFPRWNDMGRARTTLDVATDMLDYEHAVRAAAPSSI